MSGAGSEHRACIAAMIAMVRQGVDPERLVASHVQRMGARGAVAAGIAVGKAAAGMVRGLRVGLGEADWVGPVIVPRGSAAPHGLGALAPVVFAGHPLPDEESVRAGRLATAGAWSEAAGETGSEGVWVLLSGGASSMMIDPPEGTTLEDYRAVVRALLRAGAGIRDLNTVRKHIDLVKGGWLARRLAPAPVRLLVLSDVLGDDLSVIGSGPLAADPTTFADAVAVLDRFGCREAAPRVTSFLAGGVAGEHQETPKPGDAAFQGVSASVVGGNALATVLAAAALLPEFRILSRREGVEGEASVVGGALAREAVEAAGAGAGPGAIIWGGETTVTVGAASGRGGRNQEVALAAAIGIAGRPGVTIATFATDGVDGPTDAAGAIVTGETCALARGVGLDAATALANHDSHGFFAALDGAGFPHLIRTGPTGTNVNDVAVALVG